MTRIVSIVNGVSSVFLIVALSFISVVSIGQVIGRFVFHHSIFWSGECCRYLLVWIALIGTSLLISKSKMIRVSFAVNTLPPPVGRMVQICLNLFICCFLLIVIGAGVKLAIMTRAQVSVATGIPMIYMYASIPVAFSFMFLNLLDVTIREIKTGLEKGK